MSPHLIPSVWNRTFLINRGGGNIEGRVDGVERGHDIECRNCCGEVRSCERDELMGGKAKERSHTSLYKTPRTHSPGPRGMRTDQLQHCAQTMHCRQKIKQ